MEVFTFMLVNSSKIHIFFYNIFVCFLFIVCLRVGLNTPGLAYGGQRESWRVDSLLCGCQGFISGCETIEVPLPAEPVTDPGCAFQL